MSDLLTHPSAALFSDQPDGRVFLNAAYMSPKPARALEAMQARVARMASPDFGADEFFDPGERIRGLLATLLGGDAASYSLTGAASYGMATLAWNLRVRAKELVGDRRRIVVLDGQFPSNVHPWRRVADAGFELQFVPAGPRSSERLIEAVDESCALIAFAPLSWTHGGRLDVRAIVQASRAAGALSLLDVTQSAGVDPAIEEHSRPDIVVGAGYKWLLGPYGTGFMRLTPALQEVLEPLEASWKNFAGASDFNRLTEYASAFESPAAKFDHGQSSAFVRLAGWEAGLRCLIEMGPGVVREHTGRFAQAVREGLDLDSFEMSETQSGEQACHLFRIAPKDTSAFEPLTEALAQANVSVSKRDGGWRLSPHVYNGAADVERFLGVLGS